jgi:hypothetical protein
MSHHYPIQGVRVTDDAADADGDGRTTSGGVGARGLAPLPECWQAGGTRCRRRAAPGPPPCASVDGGLLDLVRRDRAAV